MNQKDIFEQIQKFIKDGNFDKAKKFLDDNKDNLGDYLDQAKKLVGGSKGLSDAIDSVKGFLGK